MTGFGDYEPEDAWHPDDPFPVLVDNLLRRLDLVERRVLLESRRDLLAAIERRVRRDRRRRRLSERDRRRLADVAVDVAFLRDRFDL